MLTVYFRGSIGNAGEIKRINKEGYHKSSGGNYAGILFKKNEEATNFFLYPTENSSEDVIFLFTHKSILT